MRDVLKSVVKVRGASRDRAPHFNLPRHVGLGYGAWAPVETEGRDPKSLGKVPTAWRDEWLGELARTPVPAEYGRAFKQWHDAFTPVDRLAVFMLDARLLLGYGNVSATEVGLTVHHTWGVPFLPGSAIKGLLAHYIDATLGPDSPRKAPYDAGSDENRERARYQGPTFDRRRIILGPGDVYRAIFGAPDADDDEQARKAGALAGASRGYVVFHDALCLPHGLNVTEGGCVGLAERRNARPGEGAEGRADPARNDATRHFEPDVLTVHQKTYYRTSGATSSPNGDDTSDTQVWPNDYDGPNPVGFLTVRPGLRFLLALSGPADWLNLIEPMLTDALSQWGIGGKTSAGYGRGRVGAGSEGRQVGPADEGGWFSPKPPPSGVLSAFSDFLQTLPPRAGSEAQWQRDVLETIDRQWLGRLRALAPAERQAAKTAIERALKPKKSAVVALRDDLIARLVAGE